MRNGNDEAEESGSESNSLDLVSARWEEGFKWFYIGIISDRKNHVSHDER